MHACLLLLLIARPAAAQGDVGLPDDPLADPDRWLSDERWGELRYGLSVREPHDAIRVLDTAQGDSIRWALEDGTRISLSFASGVYEGVKNGRLIHLPAQISVLKKQLGDEMKLSINGDVVNLRNDQTIEVGPDNEIVGTVNYFLLRPNTAGAKPLRVNEGSTLLKGFALLQLDQRSVGVVRLECKPENIDSAIRTFECLVHSVEVESPKDVNRRLHGWLSNAEDLIEGITQEDRLAAMRDDRLYRVLDGGKDIGYARIWQRYQDKAFYDQLREKDKENAGAGRLYGINRFEATGNAVVIQTHSEAHGVSIDRLAESVDQLGSIDEYWQIKNTLKYKNDPTNRRAGAWAETGIRGIADVKGTPVDHVQLTREGTPPRHMVDFLLERERDPARKLRYPSADPRSYPSGDLTRVTLPVRPRAALSFVDAQLMPALLPNEKKTYAFTAYDPETTTNDYRIMRVEPNNLGGKTVYLRPTLDKSEQTLVFDRNNELVSHSYPDGREMRKTTREELAKIWGVRLRD